MIWIAPSEKDHENAALEKRRCAAADQFRANDDLRSQRDPALGIGLVLRRFAKKSDAIFEQVNPLQHRLQNLRWTRDPLLPRLPSGQVELKTEAA